MILCPREPFPRRNFDVRSEPYESSYDRSYFYENVVYHPFVHAKTQRRIDDDSKLPISSAVPINPESVSKKTFVPKYPEYCGSANFFRRSAPTLTLKTLHERYIGHPPTPIKWGSTTTGSTYVLPKKSGDPEIRSRPSPIEEFTCPVSSSCKDGLPTFLPNERGSVRHVDPYVTSSQSAHCDFTDEQRNGVARKNIITFYDAIGLPKNRGFGPRNTEPFGSYFHRNEIAPYRVMAERKFAVPFSGSGSVYENSYNFVRNRWTDREPEIGYSGGYKSTDSAFYRTEQSHVGTGWPIRGAVDIGKVRGTY